MRHHTYHTSIFVVLFWSFLVLLPVTFQWMQHLWETPAWSHLLVGFEHFVDCYDAVRTPEPRDQNPLLKLLLGNGHNPFSVWISFIRLLLPVRLSLRLLPPIVTLSWFLSLWHLRNLSELIRMISHPMRDPVCSLVPTTLCALSHSFVFLLQPSTNYIK